MKQQKNFRDFLIGRKQGFSKLLIGGLRDQDSDGVYDYADCNPRNKRQQGIIDKIKNIIKPSPKPTPTAPPKQNIFPTSPTTGADSSGNKYSVKPSTPTLNVGGKTYTAVSGGSGSSGSSKPNVPASMQQSTNSPQSTNLPQSQMTPQQRAIQQFKASMQNTKITNRNQFINAANQQIIQRQIQDNLNKKYNKGFGERIKEDFSKASANIQETIPIGKYGDKVVNAIDRGDTYIRQKVNKYINPPSQSEKNLDKMAKDYESRLNNYNARVEAFNKNGGSEEEYNQLLSESSALQGYAASINSYSKGVNTERESNPNTLFAGIITGVATFPSTTGKLAAGLVTRPVNTVYNYGKGIVELPGNIVKNPSTTLGELFGNVAAGELLGAGIGGLSKGRVVTTRTKPKVTASISVNDAVKVGTDTFGNDIYSAEGSVITKRINPRTNKLINKVNTNTLSKAIVNQADEVLKISAKTDVLSRTNRGIRVTSDKATAIASLKTADTTANFNPSKINPEIIEGNARTTIKDYGTFKLKITPEKATANIIRRRLSPEYEALSNIKSKVIYQGEGIKNFDKGGIRISIPGESIISQSAILSDVSKTRQYVKGSARNTAYTRTNPFFRTLQRDVNVQVGRTFNPKLDTNSFSSLDSGGVSSQLKQTFKGSQAVQGTISSAVQNIAEVIKKEASKPIISKVTAQSDTVQGLGISGASSQSQRTETTAKTSTTTSPALRLLGRTDTKTNTDTKVIPSFFSGLGSGSVVTSREDQAEKQIFNQATRQSQQTKQIQQQVNAPSPVITINPVSSSFFPGESTTPRFISFEDRKKNKYQGEKPHDVYALLDSTKGNKRRWLKLADNVSREAALGIGASFVDQSSLSARFKIVEDEGEVKPVENSAWSKIGYKFRNYLIRKGTAIQSGDTFIEKARFRNDSMEERKQLSSARASSFLIGGSRKPTTRFKSLRRL